jgi:hypothetical protein
MSTMSEPGAVTAQPSGPAADLGAEPPAHTHAKNNKRKTRRRIAKALAWVAVAMTAVMVLAEPWLLLPVVTLVVALSLWD